MPMISWMCVACYNGYGLENGYGLGAESTVAGAGMAGSDANLARGAFPGSGAPRTQRARVFDLTQTPPRGVTQVPMPPRRPETGGSPILGVHRVSHGNFTREVSERRRSG